MERIQLAQGGGGEEMNALIKKLFFSAFSNPILEKMEDAASLDMKGPIAFTTDSFTVSPLFFNGGDIGKLAIAGTVNDLVMVGAKPKYLTCGFMIEEGFLFEDLKTIVQSMKDEMLKSGVKIVAGDTKVVPRGSVDGLFINTSGIGEILYKGISAHAICPGHAIIVSNEVGNHGATILAKREELDLETNLKTDCASLWGPVNALYEAGVIPISMRDATRGGLSAVLNEWAEASNVGLSVKESLIPVAPEVKGICEMLGFEPYEFANEGTMILAVLEKDIKTTLEVLKEFEATKKATLIGEANSNYPGKVILETPWGSHRFLEPPKGELLPRIC
ncbi:MAG: hydrogenase expression/formation protein HypE [Campylobacteraceae bacterium]|nr:hydrogenase expression/formation protein HypE [Campylobacteraceae bacterium]